MFFGFLFTGQGMDIVKVLRSVETSICRVSRNLAFEFVCDFQAALVHAAARRCRAWIRIRIEVRIILPIELDVLSPFP